MEETGSNETAKGEAIRRRGDQVTRVRLSERLEPHAVALQLY